MTGDEDNYYMLKFFVIVSPSRRSPSRTTGRVDRATAASGLSIDASRGAGIRWRQPPLAGRLKSHTDRAIIAIMKRASITDAKNNLSALIDGVKGGSPVLIVDRGRPVARLEPVSGVRADDGSQLARLVREGIVRPARAAMPKALFASQPPRPRAGASGVRALLEDRRDGR